MQVHHDLWNHSSAGRKHSWFPGMSGRHTISLNGTDISVHLAESSASLQRAQVQLSSSLLLLEP